MGNFLAEKKYFRRKHFFTNKEDGDIYEKWEGL